MKIIILSCNTGEGHNSAGYAIKEYLDTKNVECELVDTLSFGRRNASKKAEKAYLTSTRIPSLFQLTYMLGRLVSSPKRKSPVYYKNRSYSKNLMEYLKDNQFDIAIVTHLFPGEALTALRRDCGFVIPSLAIITDYTCSPLWEETELDYYVIPHGDLLEEFIQRGIPADKLLPFGIPVKQAFYSRIPQESARKEINQRYNLFLDTDTPWFLIMSGSMGFGKIGLLTKMILLEQKKGVVEGNVIVVCGNNEHLYQTLSHLFQNNSNVAILGFVKDISLLMDGCDALFTKPGGLSITEAAIKNIPMILTAPIPGCELNNASFFTEHGMAFQSRNIIEQITCARRISADPVFREYMIVSQKENAPYESNYLIYETLCDMYCQEGECYL